MKRSRLWILANVAALVACSYQSNQSEPLDVPEISMDEDCQIPDSFTPLQEPAVPELESSARIEVENQHITIELEEGGQIFVNISTSLVNRDSSAAVAKLGYLARVPEGLRPPIDSLEFNNSPKRSQIMTCSFDSPRNLIRPHTDTADYIEIESGPAEKVEIGLSFKSKARPDVKPSTLLGYKDVFALNWKIWDWPYTKSSIFSEIADSLELYRGALYLGKASNTTVEIRVKSKAAEIRGLSHEQNLEEIEPLKAFSWSFDSKNRPEAIEFEWIEDADIKKEIAIFSKLAEERPGDLRANIHLSNLFFLKGDHASRIEILKRILKAWETNAQEQLLVRRNDIRPAAYVGLVSSLLALGKTSEARSEAKRGLSLVLDIEKEYADETPGHANSAKLFLKKQSD